jgi:hypothetical protein
MMPRCKFSQAPVLDRYDMHEGTTLILGWALKVVIDIRALFTFSAV